MVELSDIPSIEIILQSEQCAPLFNEHGQVLLTEALREVVSQRRDSIRQGRAVDVSIGATVADTSGVLARWAAPSLTPVFNLTGTVLHTNLGRATLPPEAIAAMAEAAAHPVNLEYNLESGGRGDRDDHIEALICRLTGAEAATVVNNNAAAVLLCINTLARHQDVMVSRGELIEIGGAFRMPDIMERAECRLREVGTTNRTHLKDFAGPLTADGTNTPVLIMQVHTSNYAIEGFTAAVPAKALAQLGRAHDVPFYVDLGSGTLVDLTQFGLPPEPTVSNALKDGADLVSFSGDKMLGGPQAGIIVGRADLIAQINKNPMKRAMRVNKMTIAALHTVLQFYTDPAKLVARIPALSMLARSVEEIEAQAEQIAPVVAKCLEGIAEVSVVHCESQVGSGALPQIRIPSAGISIRPLGAKRQADKGARRLATAFRRLTCPVIGRLEKGSLLLDLRCLGDAEKFVSQMPALTLTPDGDAP